MRGVVIGESRVDVGTCNVFFGEMSGPCQHCNIADMHEYISFLKGSIVPLFFGVYSPEKPKREPQNGIEFPFVGDIILFL